MIILVGRTSLNALSDLVLDTRKRRRQVKVEAMMSDREMDDVTTKKSRKFKCAGCRPTWADNRKTHTDYD